MSNFLSKVIAARNLICEVMDVSTLIGVIGDEKVKSAARTHEAKENLVLSVTTTESLSWSYYKQHVPSNCHH